MWESEVTGGRAGLVGHPGWAVTGICVSLQSDNMVGREPRLFLPSSPSPPSFLPWCICVCIHVCGVLRVHLYTSTWRSKVISQKHLGGDLVSALR